MKYSPGNCHLQHPSGSVDPDWLVFHDPVFVDPIWQTLQYIEANIYFYRQFLGYNLHTGELIETLFILWANICGDFYFLLIYRKAQGLEFWGKGKGAVLH